MDALRFSGLYMHYQIRDKAIPEAERQAQGIKVNPIEGVELTLDRQHRDDVSEDGMDRFVKGATLWGQRATVESIGKLCDGLLSSNKRKLPTEAELRQQVKAGVVEFFKQIGPGLNLKGPDPFVLEAIEKNDIYTLSWERSEREKQPKLRSLKLITWGPTVNWVRRNTGKERLENPVSIIFRPRNWPVHTTQPSRYKLLYPGKD